MLKSKLIFVISFLVSISLLLVSCETKPDFRPNLSMSLETSDQSRIVKQNDNVSFSAIVKEVCENPICETTSKQRTINAAIEYGDKSNTQPMRSLTTADKVYVYTSQHTWEFPGTYRVTAWACIDDFDAPKCSPKTTASITVVSDKILDEPCDACFVRNELFEAMFVPPSKCNSAVCYASVFLKFIKPGYSVLAYLNVNAQVFNVFDFQPEKRVFPVTKDSYTLSWELPVLGGGDTRLQVILEASGKDGTGKTVEFFADISVL